MLRKTIPNTKFKKKLNRQPAHFDMYYIISPTAIYRRNSIVIYQTDHLAVHIYTIVVVYYRIILLYLRQNFAKIITYNFNIKRKHASSMDEFILDILCCVCIIILCATTSRNWQFFLTHTHVRTEF